MTTRYKAFSSTPAEQQATLTNAYWYTPAIPFPTNDKILFSRSLKRKKKRQKKFIETTRPVDSVVDKQTKSQSTKTVQFAVLNDTHGNATEYPMTTQMLDKTNMLLNDETFLTYDDGHDYTVTNETQFMDQTNTLNQTTSFYEYNSIIQPVGVVNKKAFESFIQTQDLTKTFLTDMSKLNQTGSTNSNTQRSVLQPYKHRHDPISEQNDKNNLTVVSLEVHVHTRVDMQPNANVDEIRFVCLTVHVESSTNENDLNYLIVYDKRMCSLMTRRYVCLMTQKLFDNIEYVYKENDLFECVLRVVHRHDPDLLVGFEIQKQSWSYLVQRAVHIGLSDFCARLSRSPSSAKESYVRYAYHHQANKSAGSPTDLKFVNDLVVCGRIALSIWRLLRSEISLNIYTFQNCCYHILHDRTPKYDLNQLDAWYENHGDLYRWKTIRYYLYRAQANIKLLNKLNLLCKTSEFARVFGIEFYHVLARGSQYRVESMMLRIAKELNYVPVSTSVKQKAQMRAAECIPLTLEPESMFYTDPVAIVDFQSLYPSVIISFNMCYTTCLGRIECIKDGSFKFGCTSLFLPDALIRRLDLHRDIYIAPNGCAFVKAHIRKGVLPIMLEDILKTRVMVKNSMKIHKANANLLKVLDSRQLSLKLIANVTFGYTAANYSGRMPCVEVCLLYCTDKLKFITGTNRDLHIGSPFN
jgi:DNA polymerase elongation subunit (family B)